MKECVICKAEGKYKCPICLIYYCSVTCCKKHREQNCDVLQHKSNTDSCEQSVSQINFPTDDTVPLEKLELLRNDQTLKDILSNPHLRELLEKVDKSGNPQELMQKAMLEPLFTEFADACLTVVEPNDEVD